MAFSLQEAIEKIRSDKVKDRQQGLEAFEHIFSDSNNVVDLDPKQDGKAWLKVFQALFACVLAEKAACIRKGSFLDAQPIAIARLQRAANMFRSLVEQAAALLARKVVKALVTHILQMMNHRGTLLRPIASAYTSALCAILSHQHHVDHLEPEDWRATASLCFDILLGRDLDGSAATSDSDERLATLAISPTLVASQRGLSLEDAVTAHCLCHLMACTVAPLLGSTGQGILLLADYTRFFLTFPVESSAHLPAMSGLNILLEHLELNYPCQVLLASLALRLTVLSLWKTKNLMLKKQLVLFLRIVVPLLASYAGGRSEVAPLQDPAARLSKRTEAAAFLRSLHETLLRDPETRWALEPIRLDALTFHWTLPDGTRSSRPSSILSNLAFYFGPFPSEQASLAWCRIGLQVDLIELLVAIEPVQLENGTPALARQGEAEEPPSTATTTQRTMLRAMPSNGKRGAEIVSSSPQKRRRKSPTGAADNLADSSPIRQLIEKVSITTSSPTAGVAARLGALQLLTFLLLTRPSLLDSSTLSETRKELLQLVADTDPVLVSWSLVGLGAIVLAFEPVKVAERDHGISSGHPGLHDWGIAVRKLQFRETCRAAAFLLGVMLSRAVLPNAMLQSEITRLVAEVDLQGPPILCDSVCHLMTLLLHRTTSNRMLHHLDARRKVGAWFASAYSPAEAFRPSTQVAVGRDNSMLVPYHDLLRLLSSIIAGPELDHTDHCMPVTYEDDVTQLLKRQARLQPLRDLSLRSSVALDLAVVRTANISADQAEPTLLSMQDFDRIAAILDKKIDSCLDVLNSVGLDDGTKPAIAFQTAISVIHAGILAVELSSKAKSLESAARVKRSCQVIVKAVNLVSKSKDMPAQAFSFVLAQLGLLDPFNLSIVTDDATPNELLVVPGLASGVASRLHLAKMKKGHSRSPEEGTKHRSKRLWTAIQEAGMLETMLSSCETALDLALFGRSHIGNDSASPAASKGHDAFDDMPESGNSSTLRARNSSSTVPTESTEIAVHVLVHLLAGVPRLLTSSADTQRDENIVSLLFECPVDAMIALAPVIFELLNKGKLWMSQRDLVDALDRIGSELLASYQFARQPVARIAAIRALRSVVPLLLEEFDEQSDLFDKVQKLASFFADQIGRTKWPSPWEVQLACARFLADCLEQDAEGCLSRAGSARASKFSPRRSMLSLNTDVDIRVRGLGSPLAACVFDTASFDEEQILHLYNDFRDDLPSDSSSPQHILTRALSLSNVAIANSAVRQSALFHLLEIILATEQLPTTVQHLFAQVAARLGFTDAPSCYQAFAGQITWGMATNNYDPLQVPWKALGFTSKRECLDATFAASGSMLLAAQTHEGRTQFDALVQLTKRSQQQGLQECLPFLTAAYLGFAVQSAQQQDRPDLPAAGAQTLQELAQLGFAESDRHEQLPRMIASADDLIVTTLLSLYFEPASSLEESRKFAIAALKTQDARSGRILSCLTPTSNSSCLGLHEPSRPFFTSAVLCATLSTLPSLGVEPFRKDVMYNVLHHIFHRIASSKFQNDQLRLSAALRIYLAMCGDSFWTDRLNACFLVSSIEQLLGQQHLHDDFRPFLVYACNRSSMAQHSPEALVSCIVTWSREIADQLVASPDSGDWLLEAARAVAKTSSIATSVTMLLWPVKRTSTEQAAIEGLIDIDTIAFAIQACPRMSVQLPSLLRVRSVLKKTSKAQIEAFCHGPAWKLLERMTEVRATHASRIDGDSPSDVISDIYACIASASEPALLQRTRKSVEAGAKGDKLASETYLATIDTSQARNLSAAAVLKIHELTQSLPLELSFRAFETLRSIACLVGGRLTDMVPSTTREELDRIRPSISPMTNRPGPFHPERFLGPALLDASASSNNWICRITATMCEAIASFKNQDLFQPIGQFVSMNHVAAETLFHVLLLCFTVVDAEPAWTNPSSGGRKRTSGRRSDLEGQLSSLQMYRAAIATHFEHVLSAPNADPTCSSMIVQSLLAVRSFRPVQEEPDEVCFWFQVDTNLLARRCIACGLYSAAIFFVEHGNWEQDESQACFAPQAQIRADLLQQAYMNIDDPDAFYGIKDGDVRELLLKRLHHEGQWLRAFQYHAADCEASSFDGGKVAPAQANALGQTFSMLGFQHLANGVDLTLEPSGGAAPSLAIRTDVDSTSWDLPVTSNELVGGKRVESVLRILQQANDEQDVDEPLSLAIQSQLQLLCSIPAESVTVMRSIQGDLLSLGQIKDWRKASTLLGLEEAVVKFRSVWCRADVGDQFEVAEKILRTRQLLLQAVRQRLQSDQIGDALDRPAEEIARVERLLLVQLSRQAREHEKLQKAINATARAESIEVALGDGANLAREEFAAVLWDQKEHSPAMQLLSQIVDDLGVTTRSTMQQKRRGARLLSLLAQWRATARSQHPREIDGTLFEPALKLLVTPPASEVAKDAEVSAEQSEIAYRWARFAEEHHRGSDMAEIMRLRVYIQRRTEEIAQNQREYDKTSSKTDRGKLLQFQRQAEKILRQDQTRLSELEASRTLFLRRSIAMYARALSSSDVHDDAVARLISLWFENSDNAELNRLLVNCLASIPSRKFVALMHQLSARLTELPDQRDPMAPFQSNLGQLLLRMCQEHPFHCLYAIFALIKTGADTKAASNRSTSRSSLGVPDTLSASSSSPILRSTAAEKIWNHIKRHSSHGKRIRIFEELCLAYVEWAEFDLASRPDRYFQGSGAIKKGALRMPPSGELRLARMRDLDVPVATARLEIDATCKYEKVVSIVRYSETFTTAGGIHLPKISECIGSDGKRYKQLFKRDDDLRQDAVMQQVFRMVNELLKADRRTRERKLVIRTYTVLPLGPQCGMLEFVTNTVPLGEVLIALHAKYRPGDLTPSQARTKMRDAQSLGAEAKLEAFLDVCEQMRPAFGYFFSDAQRMPRDWYETRLRYTRSVSTSSIVGHVLGLGDRHVSNMLLDKESGELVHIDFGVAFDQGKLLPIPELVPFRLTRDIVDGMGMHGVEGTFRRCCEETLRVLRAHQDVIKTVLEVFRHDPLFAWTSNPIKVLRAQEDKEEEEQDSLAATSVERSGTTMGVSRSTPAPTPTLLQARGTASRSTTPFAAPYEATGVLGTDTAELSADRAVTSVMSKLSSSLSIEYTVNDLIQQATDAGHLSAIFHGWQAAL